MFIHSQLRITSNRLPSNSIKCSKLVQDLFVFKILTLDLLTLGVLLLLPVGVLMESRLCWYLAWYFSFMWLVWSLMLWLCFTLSPPGTEGWCLQDPPP